METQIKLISAKELKKSWWIGYLHGIINGLSMRSDVPKDIRNNLDKVLVEYQKWESEE